MNVKRITFQRDALGRKEFCSNLTNRILTQCKSFLEEGYSLSIHGTYGTGKTWPLTMWKNLLEEQDTAPSIWTYGR